VGGGKLNISSGNVCSKGIDEKRKGREKKEKVFEAWTQKVTKKNPRRRKGKTSVANELGLPRSSSTVGRSAI